MKNTIRLITSLLTLILISSCTTVSSFNSPNNIGNLKSTLYLNDGRSITGHLTINSENKKNSKISIQSGTHSRPQVFKLKHVKGYSIGDEHFLLKEIDNNTIVMEKGNSLLEQLLTKKKYYFMKRLTPENSRIHLYENEYVRAPYGNSTTASRIIEYFVQLPRDSSNKVYAIEGKKLIPHFELKMSALVSDCPVLASKIAHKQPGYYYAPLSFPILSQRNPTSVESSAYAEIGVVKDKNAAVLLQIINEYNQCQ